MLLTVFSVFELHPQSPTAEMPRSAAAEDGSISPANINDRKNESENEITIEGDLW